MLRGVAKYSTKPGRACTQSMWDVVDLFHSESLKNRFSDPNYWPGGEPGDFTISYDKIGARR